MVVNALNGALPQVFREAFPDAEIVCGETFPYFREHLESLGFEVVDWNGDWGDMKFDLIIGNPPYQDTDLPENNALWPRIVNKAFNDLLLDNGIMAMVTPSSWMNPSGEEVKRKEEYNTGSIRKNILGRYKTISVDVSENVKKHFSVGSTFSYYIVEKTLVTDHLTNIKTDMGHLQVDLAKIKFLPAILSPLSYSITNKFFSKPPVGVTNMKGEGFHSSHSKRVVKEITPGYDYPLADTSAKYLKGQWLWANEPHPYQYVKKVIISESGYLGPMFDPGKLGTTEHSFVIPVESESHGNKLVAQLNSRLFVFIMTVCRWGSANHKYIIKNLPACEGNSDQEIYQYFELSKEEIAYVESVVKTSLKTSD